jgi:phenol 2-monooxygenase
VRKAIGGALHGDAAHQAWGVMDLLANTDFPDWRMKSFVRSPGRGHPDGAAARGRPPGAPVCGARQARRGRARPTAAFTQEDIIAKANRILRPYTLDVKEVVWWSIYEIGHS